MTAQDNQEQECQTWTVWRQDDNGNTYIVEGGLDRKSAEELVAELESHGHKQLYYIAPS